MGKSQGTMARAALLCVAIFMCAVVASEIPTETVERKVEHLGIHPRLHLVRGFATDAEMDYIIDQAFPAQRPQDQETETGIVTELNVSRDPILIGVFDRMRMLLPNLAPKLSVDSQSLDTFRVRRYLPDGIALKGGDYHPPHTDWFEPTKGDLSHVLIVTMILYLTSPEEGGTTYFKHAMGGKGYHFQPVRGNLAVWWSCYRNGTQDFHSDHSSEPLKQGIKWNAARFFYADVKRCDDDVADTVLVPAAADANVAMKSSFDVKYGTSFPPGVSVTERGTSTNETLHGASRYTYDDDDSTYEDDDYAAHGSAVEMDQAAADEKQNLIEQALAEMQAARLSSEL